MIVFRGARFEAADACVSVLDRNGSRTWGVEIQGHDPVSSARAPRFLVHGLALPAAGSDDFPAQVIDLKEGESQEHSAPQALIYVWDWAPANENRIEVQPQSTGRIRVRWTGSCDDPDAYNANRLSGTFEIDCVCDLSYTT
jgi:hypothetical protein